MKLDYIIDTNIFISLFEGLLREPIPNGKLGYSLITEIELLSYPKLSATDEQFIYQQLQPLTFVPINQDITKKTIWLRRQYQLKIPDAIVVASAWSMEATLLTNDQQLTKISEITVTSILT